MSQELNRPVTEYEAEVLAKKAIGDYLTACRMQNRGDIGNALMKMASVVGILMAANEGREIAAQRLLGTAAFVQAEGPQFPQRMEIMQ